MGQKKITIVTGPTASGKSSYALDLALQWDGVILNADSIQLYKGLPLLTAQPSPEAKERVPHLLYEIFPSNAPFFSAGQWIARLHPLIETILNHDQTPLVVGGSGFYLLALTKGLSPIPPVPLEIQKNLEEEPLADLYAKLCHIDPLCAARLNPQDSQRIMRAVGVWQSTQKTLSQWHEEPRLPLPYTFDIKVLMPEKSLLWRQIEHRLKEMIKAGVFEEIKVFLETLENKKLEFPLKKALGFQEIKAFWDNKITHPEAIQKTLEKTRQYAKRQMTWFRHQLPACTRISKS